MMVRPPSRARLRHFYEVEYPEAFDHEQVTASRHALFADIIARVGRRRAPGRLLDVGCSGGQFLQLATARGWRGVGTDLSFEASALARRTTRAPVFQADSLVLPIRDGIVDVVTLLSIVDHTSDPLRTVTEAARVLAPGGHLVVRIPNGLFHQRLARLIAKSSLLARRIQPPPVLQVFSLTPRSVSILCERAGLRVVECRNSALVADAHGIVRCLARALAAAVRVIEMVSAHRVLLAPSVELYAEKPAAGPAEPRA
ncbi:MAG: class I SAM-dependent methyltransferase [Candidatus Rokubacteria bacterium]|nr:class I SAM-dependent methyltransferase [Candidatus Rokubacteria bacterium]